MLLQPQLLLLLLVGQMRVVGVLLLLVRQLLVLLLQVMLLLLLLMLMLGLMQHGHVGLHPLVTANVLQSRGSSDVRTGPCCARAPDRTRRGPVPVCRGRSAWHGLAVLSW